MQKIFSAGDGLVLSASATSTPLTTKIYSLQDETGNIRYIGKTVQGLRERFSKHLCDARCGIKGRRCNWVRSILSRGKWPSIFLIGEVEGDGCKEEIAWIDYFRSEGIDLVNVTAGGEGILGHRHSEESIRKMSEAHKGRVPSFETRQKLREAMTGRFVSIETRQKRSKSLKGHKSKKGVESPLFGRHRSAETCRKISEAHKGKHLSEEHKRKLSENGARSFLGHHHTEESRRKMSESRKGKPPTEAQIMGFQKMKQALLGRHFSDETRKKLSESKMGNKHTLGFRHSEESLKKMSIAQTGKHLSAETRRKISEARLRFYRLKSTGG